MHTDFISASTYQSQINPAPASRKSSGSKPAAQASKGKVQGIFDRFFKSNEDKSANSPLIKDKQSSGPYGTC